MALSPHRLSLSQYIYILISTITFYILLTRTLKKTCKYSPWLYYFDDNKYEVEDGQRVDRSKGVTISLGASSVERPTPGLNGSATSGCASCASYQY